MKFNLHSLETYTSVKRTKSKVNRVQVGNYNEGIFIYFFYPVSTFPLEDAASSSFASLGRISCVENIIFACEMKWGWVVWGDKSANFRPFSISSTTHIRGFGTVEIHPIWDDISTQINLRLLCFAKIPESKELFIRRRDFFLYIFHRIWFIPTIWVRVEGMKLWK